MWTRVVKSYNSEQLTSILDDLSLSERLDLYTQFRSHASMPATNSIHGPTTYRSTPRLPTTSRSSHSARIPDFLKPTTKPHRRSAVWRATMVKLCSQSAPFFHRCTRRVGNIAAGAEKHRGTLTGAEISDPVEVVGISRIETWFVA
jgi:hypothetical protein